MMEGANGHPIFKCRNIPNHWTSQNLEFSTKHLALQELKGLYHTEFSLFN